MILVHAIEYLCQNLLLSITAFADSLLFGLLAIRIEIRHDTLLVQVLLIRAKVELNDV